MSTLPLRWAMVFAVLASARQARSARVRQCRLSLVVRVIDDVSGEGVDRVRAHLTLERKAFREADKRSLVLSAQGAPGRYEASQLCSGRYRLSLARTGYGPRVLSVSLPQTGPLPLTLTPEGVQQLGDVVVEATAPRPVELLPSAGLEGAKLDRTRGLQLADALSGLSGVTVLRSGANAKPMVRGQFGRRLLTLFDGVRHEGQRWGLDHAPEVDPLAAGRLRVIKGAAGVRYGPDAVGGAVLIDPLPLLKQPGYREAVDLIGQTNGLGGTVAARIDGAPASIAGLAFRLEGNFSRTAAVKSPDYPLDNTGRLVWNLGATVTYSKASWALKLSFRHHDNQSGVFSGLRNKTPDAFFDQLARDRPLQVASFDNSGAIERPFQQVAHDLWLLRGKRDVWGGTLTVSYAFQSDQRQEFDVVPAYVGDEPQFDFDLQTHTLDASFDQPVLALNQAWKLAGQVGFSGLVQTHEYQGTRPLIPGFTQLNWGVFAIQRLSHKKLDVEAGLRFDHIQRWAELTDLAYAKHAGVSPARLSPNDCSPRGQGGYRCPTGFEALTASVGALWYIRPGYSLGLSGSSAARAPMVDEQYLDGSSPTSPVIGVGDPQLGLETSWNLSLTGRVTRRLVDAEVSGYVNLIDNYIYFAPELDASGQLRRFGTVRGEFPLFVHRAVKALYYGVDGGLTIGRQLPVELDLRVAAVWARDLDRDAFLLFVPPLRAQIAATYKPPSFWGLKDSFLRVTGLLVARQERFDPNADFAPPPRGYALLGVSLGTSRRLRRGRLSVSLDLQNLLNVRYRDYTSLLRYFADEPGRAALLRLSYQTYP